MDDTFVTVTVTLAADDYCEVQAQTTRKRRLGLSICLWAASFALLYAATSDRPALLWLLVAGVPVALALSLYLGLPLVLRRKWSARFNDDKALHTERIYTFQKAGIGAWSNQETIRYAWDNLHAAFEAKQGFYLYISERRCMYIPKRCVDNSDLTFIRHCLLRKNSKNHVPFLVRVKTNGFMYLGFILFLLLVLYLLVNPG